MISESLTPPLWLHITKVIRFTWLLSGQHTELQYERVQQFGFRPVGTYCSRMTNDVIKQRQRQKSLRGGGMAEDCGSLGDSLDKGPFMVLTKTSLSRPEHKDIRVALRNS